MDTVMIAQPLDAADFRDAADQIIQSAELLAQAVIQRLDGGAHVEISLQQLRGLSSSYFNTLLAQVAAARGIESLHRLHFRFSSAAQKTVYDRSLASILRQA